METTEMALVAEKLHLLDQAVDEMKAYLKDNPPPEVKMIDVSTLQ